MSKFAAVQSTSFCSVGMQAWEEKTGGDGDGDRDWDLRELLRDDGKLGRGALVDVGAFFLPGHVGGRTRKWQG